MWLGSCGRSRIHEPSLDHSRLRFGHLLGLPEPFLPLDSLHPPHADPAAVGFRPRSYPSRVATSVGFIGARGPSARPSCADRRRTNPSRSDAAPARASSGDPRARWIGVIRLRLLAIGRLVSSPTTFDNRAIRSVPAAGRRAPRHRNLALDCYSPWPYRNAARATIEACGGQPGVGDEIRELELGRHDCALGDHAKSRSIGEALCSLHPHRSARWRSGSSEASSPA